MYIQKIGSVDKKDQELYPIIEKENSPTILLPSINISHKLYLLILRFQKM